MWHEARRREKATQKLLNEHKKRAEKRREENRIDPNSFLQVNGIKSKLSLDPNVYKQAAKSLVAWQGDKDIMIDRFDVRATLTSLPPDLDPSKNTKVKQPKVTVLDADESEEVKKLLNFERYRLLVQNDLNKVSEELRLKLVSKSEFSTSDAKLRKLRYNKFGTSGDMSISQAAQLSHPMASTRHPPLLRAPEQNPRRGATISFNYNSSSSTLTDNDKSHTQLSHIDASSNSGKTDFPHIIDLDDFPDHGDLDSVELTPQTDRKRLNDVTTKYGLSSDEFGLILKKNKEEVIEQGDILNELSKLIKRKEAGIVEDSDKATSSTKSTKSLIYGPTLPPELESKDCVDGLTNLSPSDSSSQGSPVQQRSPNGATIPLREDADASSIKDKDDQDRLSATLEKSKNSTTSIEEKLKQTETLLLKQRAQHLKSDINLTLSSTSSLSENREMKRTTDNSHPSSRSSTSTSSCSFSSSSSSTSSSSSSYSNSSYSSEESADSTDKQHRHHRYRSRTRSRSRSKSRKRRQTKQGTRRASTPLAYKRNRRSSRSLSRERKSNAGHSYKRSRRY